MGDPRNRFSARKRRLVAAMSLEEKVGQTIFPALRCAYPPPPGLREKLRELGVGGVLLRDGGVGDALRLLDSLQADAGIPLIVCSDMERGVGERLAGATAFPANMALAAGGDRSLVREQAVAVAREARILGIHLLLAPVVDVDGPARCPIVGTRSYSDDAGVVARLAGEYIAACSGAGVGTCAKHFPGHGAATGDSHAALPVLDRSRLDLMGVEFVPFRRAIEAGVDAIMVGHIAVPAICGEGGPPASLSEEVIQGVIRTELEFDGLVLTDALLMGGATAVGSEGDVAVRSLAAGADVALCPSEAREIHRAILAAVRDGSLPEERLDEAVLRVLRFKGDRGLLDQIRRVGEETFLRSLKRRRARAIEPRRVREGPEESLQAALGLGRRTAERTADTTIALLRNEDSLLPLGETVSALLVHAPDRVDPFAGGAFVEAVARRIEIELFQLLPPRTAEDLERLRRRAAQHDLLIWAELGRAAAWRASTEKGLTLDALGAPQSVFVALGSPVLLDQVEGGDAWVCAFSDAEVSQMSAARALFGDIPFRGRLPITCKAGERGFGLTLPESGE